MLKKRIIPCLDIKNGRTVKGINFIELKDVGDPVELALRYRNEGADEIVFLDITATLENRRTLHEVVKNISSVLDIPFTVGGGINSVEDVNMLLENGADKVSINSSAIKNPKLVEQLCKEFGSQCIVVAIDTKKNTSDWEVFSHGGTIATNKKTIDWALEVEQLGAGEILLTSMNNDGTKKGFAIDITDTVSKALNIPVIASGGAGQLEDFTTLFQNTQASAALAASIFHLGEISIPDLKNYLNINKIPVR
jgi:imidazole glycerol-phosphate synthase subunit HisF